MKKIIIISLAAVLTGCASSMVSTTFTELGENQFSPRPIDCKVTNYKSAPDREFSEIGIVDIKALCVGLSCPDTNTVSGVNRIVSEDVCKAGGDAIVLGDSTGGYYSNVTVLKFK